MAAPEIPCEIRDTTRAIALPRHSDRSALAEHPAGESSRSQGEGSWTAALDGQQAVAPALHWGCGRPAAFLGK